MELHANDNLGPYRYSGPERRKSYRRKIADRRDGIRFEAEKPPRRVGTDRRSHQYLWNTPEL